MRIKKLKLKVGSSPGPLLLVCVVCDSQRVFSEPRVLFPGPSILDDRSTTEMKNDLDNGHLYQRLHKSSCCPEKTLPCNCLFHVCRKAVSGTKVRWEKEGFDLDLTYLSDRIIVHGFPAVGIEHIYRNPRFELKRFLDTRHMDRYKVYNFCCEPGRGYDPEVYHGRVERYPFKDHNTPPLETMVQFAESAKVWMDAHPENVCSLHCKAGKGRAGLMSCILLLRSGTFSSAVEALNHYDSTRVTNKKGLTVVSQRKYVIFYEELWRQHWGVKGDIGQIPGELPGSKKWILPDQPEFQLVGIEVLHCNLPLRHCRVKVFKGSYLTPALIWDSGASKETKGAFDCSCVIQGNFKIHVEFKPSFFSTKGVRLFDLWHNTLFMERNQPTIDFMQDQLDMKKKVSAKIGPRIILRLNFCTFTRDVASFSAPSGVVEDSGSGSGSYEMVSQTDQV